MNSRLPRIVACLLVGLLATACSSIATIVPNLQPTCQTATGEQKDLCQAECAKNRSSRACLCLTEGKSAECLEVCSISPRPAGCPVQCPNKLAAELVKEAIEDLSQGETDSGANLVECALERNPSYPPAKKLQQQLELTPENYFGTKRTTNYRIVQGDTLATIAQNCLKDKDNFLALAKLNNILDPRSIQIDQIIRLPGMQPCLDVNVLIAEARTEFNAGNLETAYKKIDDARQLRKNAEVEQLHLDIASAYTEQLHDTAASLFYEGNCPKARDLWYQILKIYPDDEFARDFLADARC